MRGSSWGVGAGAGGITAAPLSSPRLASQPGKQLPAIRHAAARRARLAWALHARALLHQACRPAPPRHTEYAPELPAAASNIAGRFGRVEADLLPLLAAAGLAGGQAEELQVEMRMPADKWW